MHPGQAQARVPAIAYTRSKCLVQMLPWWAGEPQELWQLAGQTHPMGTGDHPSLLREPEPPPLPSRPEGQ